jgi:membrane fusion protein (multidrug efflux system)
MKGQKVLVSRNGTAQEVIVQIGFRSASKVQILDGIQKGDTVITSGIMGLKAGTPLKIISISK